MLAGLEDIHQARQSWSCWLCLQTALPGSAQLERLSDERHQRLKTDVVVVTSRRKTREQ